MIITPELKQAIERSGGQPVRIEDPETRDAYVVLRAEVYDRIRSLVAYDGGDWTEQERAMLLRDFAARAGWDDPLMDEYNGLQAP